MKNWTSPRQVEVQEMEQNGNVGERSERKCEMNKENDLIDLNILCIEKNGLSSVSWRRKIVNEWGRITLRKEKTEVRKHVRPTRESIAALAASSLTPIVLTIA
jgi:hypothetical protein